MIAFAVMFLAALPVDGPPSHSSGTTLDCTFVSRAEEEIVVEPGCATLDPDGRLRLAPGILDRLSFDSHGLASIHAGVWHYVRRDGASAAVPTFDNWADEFANGLVRTVVEGKFGYANRRLELVIPARYDGAFPFERGRAVVCIDCRLEPHGEHSLYRGGSWGCIDRRGRVVVPLRPRLSEATAATC